MDWSEYVTTLQTMLQLADPEGAANFFTVLPQLNEAAELRMFRDPDLDFLATRTTDRTQVTTAGSRAVTIPPAFVVVEDLALITPAGYQPSQAGAQRVPLLRTTRGFIDTTWPQESLTQAPQPYQSYWAIFSEQESAGLTPPAVPTAGTPTRGSSALIAPTPDAGYVAEFRGTFRPQAFWQAAGFNPATGEAINGAATTFLSTYLPDLLIAASLVWGAAYLMDFGASSDNPQLAVSWETYYQRVKAMAASEENRKKSAGWNWSSFGVPYAVQVAAPPAPPAQAA